MNEPVETMRRINRLATTCKDGEDGYSRAAELVGDAELTGIFRANAERRADLRRTLEGAVERMGGSPTSSSSLASAAHRAWFEGKAMLADDKAHAVINECRRGDSAALEEFDKALVDADLGTDHREVLAEGRASIQRSLAELDRQADRLAHAS